jgi:hypothetical protein
MACRGMLADLKNAAAAAGRRMQASTADQQMCEVMQCTNVTNPSKNSKKRAGFELPRRCSNRRTSVPYTKAIS